MRRGAQGSEHKAVSDTGLIIGDIAGGALAARAVEPAHGESTEGHTHEAVCLNCGTALVGSHCHSCGQAAHVHKTISAFFHDLVHGVFHFEGKIWRTLPMLAWHPGRLTRQYIDGRRASYVSPIALFLFVVFLTFALFNLAGEPIHIDESKAWFASTNNATAEAEAVQRLGKLKADLARATKAGELTAPIEGQIAGAEGALAGIRAEAASKTKLPGQIAQSDNPADRSLTDTINRAWQKATTNPDLAIYKAQSSAYKYSWLLIPLSVPFMWLLFPFSRRFRLYDHTVFVTYSLCFMLLVLAAMTAINVWLTADWLMAALALYVPFHMHRQLRETYGLSRYGALWRTSGLAIFSMIVLTLFGIAVLALSMS